MNVIVAESCNSDITIKIDVMAVHHKIMLLLVDIIALITIMFENSSEFASHIACNVIFLHIITVKLYVNMSY